MTFLAIPVAQMQTGPLGAANCVPSITSELLSLASVDALNIGAQKIRQQSGDFSGGIDLDDAARAANQLTDYLYPLVAMRIEEDEKARLKDIWRVGSTGALISASVTVHTEYRTNGFTGNHGLTVAGGTLKERTVPWNGKQWTGLTVKVEDPGTTTAGWKAWPVPLLIDAMLATRSTSGVRLNAFFILRAPRTEDVDRTATRAVAVRSKPDRTAPRLGGLAKGRDVHVIRTTRGGPWLRPDGTKGHGWHVIEYRDGRGYVVGKGLR